LDAAPAAALLRGPPLPLNPPEVPPRPRCPTVPPVPCSPPGFRGFPPLFPFSPSFFSLREFSPIPLFPLPPLVYVLLCLFSPFPASLPAKYTFLFPALSPSSPLRFESDQRRRNGNRLVGPWVRSPFSCMSEEFVSFTSLGFADILQKSLFCFSLILEDVSVRWLFSASFGPDLFVFFPPLWVGLAVFSQSGELVR